jgi:hypothetical protein
MAPTRGTNDESAQDSNPDKAAVQSDPYFGAAGRDDASPLQKGTQMKKTAALLASAVVPLVAGLVITASSNAQSVMTDEAYCRVLVKELTHGGIERGFAPESFETSVAINQCLDGNPQPAIPVLERKLIGNDFNVPPRN